MVKIYQYSSHNFTKAMFSKLIWRSMILHFFCEKLVTFNHSTPSKAIFVFLLLSKALNESLKNFKSNLKFKRHLWTLKVPTSIVCNPVHLDMSLISCQLLLKSVIIGGFLAFIGSHFLICGDILSFLSEMEQFVIQRIWEFYKV